MMTAPQLDPTGALITELRAAPALAALVGNRVRGYEPEPGDLDGTWQAVVVVKNLGSPPHPSVPVTWATYAALCYGTTPQHAWSVYAALAAALHEVGPRVKSSGLGIYRSAIINGGEQDQHPDTKQPLVIATISLIATTQAVAT